MAEPDARARRTIEVADTINRMLTERGVAVTVIGAIAAAAHKYVRDTHDFDLATHTHPYPALSALARELAAMGFEAEFVDPDGDDPLGGVINVRGDDFDDVQVVNFFNPYRGRNALAEEALAASRPHA